MGHGQAKCAEQVLNSNKSYWDISTWLFLEWKVYKDYKTCYLSFFTVYVGNAISRARSSWIL